MCFLLTLLFMLVHLAAHHLTNSLLPPFLFKGVCTHVPYVEER